MYLFFIISDRETISQYFSQFCQSVWYMHRRHDCVGYLISFSVFYLLPCLLNKESLKKKPHWNQPNSVNAYKTRVHKRQEQIRRACGEDNCYPGQCCLAFPLRCPAHQQQTSHHFFAPALSGNLALNEASGTYSSSAKIWWAHGLSIRHPEVLQVGSVAMPFF